MKSRKQIIGEAETALKHMTFQPDWTPEMVERYKAAYIKWSIKLEPLQEACRQSQRLTAEDMNTRIGPCHD